MMEARWDGTHDIDTLSLETERLRLRPLIQEDALWIQKLCADEAIAATTEEIPHPYPEGDAKRFIARTRSGYRENKSLVFGIISKELNHLIGCIEFEVREKSCIAAKLGYWIGKPFWGRGFCTEAARRVLEFIFNELQDWQIACVYAEHFSGNPASGKVMTKIGMKREGCLRSRCIKWGKVRDLETYSILKEELNK